MTKIDKINALKQVIASDNMGLFDVLKFLAQKECSGLMHLEIKIAGVVFASATTKEPLAEWGFRSDKLKDQDDKMVNFIYDCGMYKHLEK